MEVNILGRQLKITGYVFSSTDKVTVPTGRFWVVESPGRFGDEDRILLLPADGEGIVVYRLTVTEFLDSLSQAEATIHGCEERAVRKVVDDGR